jgi:hypothetical protein
MRADRLTRDGQLGEAVWAYLEVLEVDPDNSQARRQVGRVATAVRQFDQTAPARKWQMRLRGHDWSDGQDRWPPWLKVVVIIGLLAATFFLGYQFALTG